MNTLLFTLFACGEKEEDTGIDVEDTAVEDTDTEDTDDTEDTSDTEDTEDTEDTSDTAVDEFAYLGTYTDNFGGEHTIAADTWASGSFLFHISQYSNDEGFVIAQNDSEYRSQYCDDWSLSAYTQEDCESAGGNWIDLADKWSRFDVFSDADGGLHYCQSEYGADTEEDAMAASADSSDLAAGCNGFSWSKLREKFVYTGTYDDNFGGSHTINAFKWDSGSLLFHVSQYSNTEGWLIAQNDSEKRSQYCDDWSLSAYTQEDCESAGGNWIDLADKWSRFDVFSDADGGLHYCQSEYGADTEEDAMAASADSSDLAAGCNGFGWTQFITE